MNNTIKPIIFDLDDVRNKAENGDKFACYILGRSYDSEENGAEQSFEKAMYWYEKGKELGKFLHDKELEWEEEIAHELEMSRGELLTTLERLALKALEFDRQRIDNFKY